MSLKESKGKSLERASQFILSGILLLCFIVIAAEFLFFVWVLQQEAPKVLAVSFGDIAIFILLCLLSLLPLVILVLSRRQVCAWLFSRQLKIAEQWRGPKSSLVSRACVALADCYTDDGRFDEAEKLYKRAVAINAEKGIRGNSHFHIQTELRYLRFLRKSNRLDRAVAIAPYLLELERRFRPYAYAGKVLYALALVFAFLATGILMLDWAAASSTLAGNYGLAREICAIAPAPPAMLPAFKVGKSMEVLARGYSQGKQWEKAESVYQTLLEVQQTRDGSASPAAAEVLQCLSEAYFNQGKYKKAKHLLEQALQIYGDDPGSEDPRIGRALNDLATIYCTEDKYDQSQQLIKRALCIYEKHRGPNDPCVAESVGRLASVCCRKGRFAQAEPLYKLALAMSEENYGANDPRVATALNDYADLLRKTNKILDAEKLEARARAIKAARRADSSSHKRTKTM